MQTIKTVYLNNKTNLNFANMDKKNLEKTVPSLFPHLWALSLNRAINGCFCRPINSERLKISKI